LDNTNKIKPFVTRILHCQISVNAGSATIII